MTLSAHHISIYFHYPRKRCILYDYSATFYAGKISVITGASGVGKSTLLYSLAGIQSVDRGDITLAGTSVCSASWSDMSLIWTDHLSLVFQYPYLISELPVWDNIAIKGYVNGESRHNIDARVACLAHDVDIMHVSDAYPDELSGGQQQRVALARALFYTPQFIIADEPTAHLDVASASVLLNLFSYYRDYCGCGVIIATHDHRTIDHADVMYKL